MNYSFFNPKNIVFTTWAGILFFGFLATHFYQHPNINWVWSLLSVIGLFVMYKYMPFRVIVLRRTFYHWLGVIVFGMAVSFGVFYVENIGWLLEYLGMFWLILLGLGHVINKPLYPGQKGLLQAGILQIVAGVMIWFVPQFLEYQYIIAAFASSAGMLLLIERLNLPLGN